MCNILIKCPAIIDIKSEKKIESRNFGGIFLDYGLF
jgi:hypothetical protein